MIRKNNILVLMDFSESSYIALKYAISLAKLIKGSIVVLHIGNLKKITDNEHPLIILSEVDSETEKIKDKLASITEIISTEGLQVNSHYSYGRKIYELKNHINRIRPYLIIIGKRKSCAKSIGRLTSFLINEYCGSLLVVGEEMEFKKQTKISLGYNVSTLGHCDLQLVSKLKKQTKAPLTLFNVSKPKVNNNKVDLLKTWQSFYETDRNIKFEYKESSNIVNGLIEHISEKDIELFCVGRSKKSSCLINLFCLQNFTLSKIINKVTIPILVLSNNNKLIK